MGLSPVGTYALSVRNRDGRMINLGTFKAPDDDQAKIAARGLLEANKSRLSLDQEGEVILLDEYGKAVFKENEKPTVEQMTP